MTDRPELELLPSGKVVLHFDDAPDCLLRRPTVGEFFKIRERTYEVQDELDEANSDIFAEADTLDKRLEADPPPEPAVRRELRKQKRDLGRKLHESGDEKRIEQWREIVRILGSRELPASNSDLPLWATSQEALNGVQSHWRDTPLVFGEQ